MKLKEELTKSDAFWIGLLILTMVLGFLTRFI